MFLANVNLTVDEPFSYHSNENASQQTLQGVTGFPRITLLKPDLASSGSLGGRRQTAFGEKFPEVGISSIASISICNAK